MGTCHYELAEPKDTESLLKMNLIQWIIYSQSVTKHMGVEKEVYSQLVLHTKKRFLVLQVQATATASQGRENKAIVEIIGT